MSDIYSLLNIDPDVLRDFSLKSILIENYQTERAINKNTDLLKKIENQMLTDNEIKASPQSIDEVINKIKKYSSKQDLLDDNWSLRELRITSYYLMKLHNNSEAHKFALELLNIHWKNLFFNGLVFYLMNFWNVLETEYRERTCNLVKAKLHQYQDNNKRYLMMKNHADFFEKAGPVRMATLIKAKNMQFFDAPTILGFKNTTINQSYYSDVIVKYIESNHINNLDYIERLFEHHSLDRTKKLLFIYLVESENENNDPMRQIALCRFANHVLGDITSATSWAPFSGATFEEAQRLKRAMNVVNIWFAKQIIETFFEVCVQDKERKIFWLNYVNYIEAFKIVGSRVTKQLLQSNSNIGSLFIDYYIETNSITSQTSALVIYIKNKMIVEFSDKGALYVYNQSHSMYKLVSKSSRMIGSTNDLKIPSMQSLIEPDYYYKEGRMTHQGYWQSRLKGWMEKMVLSPDNTGQYKRKTDDESIFKATPLYEESEEVIIKTINEESSKQKLLFKDSEMQTKHIITINSANESLTKEISEANVLQDIVYENRVFPIQSSKIFEDNLRVVADHTGLYVTNTLNAKFALIKKLNKGIPPLSNIWIKKSKTSDWNEVIHFYNDTQFSIGFLLKVENIIYFKESINMNDKKIIEL